MAWLHHQNELPELLAAFAEAENAVGAAFTQMAARHGYTPQPLRVGNNPNDPVSRWIEWWFDLSPPFDALSCEVDLLDSSDGPEVWGRVAVWQYLGRGVDFDDDLWRSEDIAVRSPAEAAAALRRVTADLVWHLVQLDLRASLANLRQILPRK